MRIYATPEDLAGEPWGLQLEAPAASALLRRATLRVEALTVSAHYATDVDTGLPVHPALVSAFKDAVCAYAVYLEETGDLSGADAQYAQLSLGSFSAARSTPHGENRITPPQEVVDILRAAGLLSGAQVIA